MAKFFQDKYSVSASALGIFRIIFFSCQFGEFLQTWYCKELIFDIFPFLQPYDPPKLFFLIAWATTLIFLILGFKTRYAAVANYALTLVYISVTQTYEYHMDYAYTGVNFLCMFLPLGLSYSLDSLFSDKKEVPKVGFYNHYIVVFAGAALIYFDSIFHKIAQESWMNGLGLWLPASLPQLTYQDLSWITNMKYVVIPLGYITLAFETLLIFLMWFRPLGLILSVIGILFHIGIFICFPIPYFAVSYCAFYILLLPASYFVVFDKAFMSFKNWFQSVVSVRFIDHNYLGFSKRYAIYLMIFFFVLQLFAITNSPSLSPYMPKTLIKFVANFQKNFTRPLFGITGHGVFLDWHYDATMDLPIVKYQGENLPILQDSGQVGKLTRGRLWADIAFRNLNMKNPAKFKAGLRKYTAFWAIKNGMNLKNLDFELYKKRVTPIKEWKKDYLKEQMARPIEKVADLKWRNYKFQYIPVK